MRMRDIRDVLEKFKAGKMSLKDTVDEICAASIAPLADACVDIQRFHRRGFGEVVFCERKTPEQVARIAQKIVQADGVLLATRANNEHYVEVKKLLPDANYYERARCITYGEDKVKRTGLVVIICAGTSDLPVAEEAKCTAEMCGSNTELITDVGIAGVHRLTPHLDTIRRARVVVVVAGMEGALPSLIAGLVSVPVIGVPTSVGYGASFGGVAALLAMLNSCSPGVLVVNIDNGFGAGYSASLINKGDPYGRSFKAKRSAKTKTRRS